MHRVQEGRNLSHLLLPNLHGTQTTVGLGLFTRDSVLIRHVASYFQNGKVWSAVSVIPTKKKSKPCGSEMWIGDARRRCGSGVDRGVDRGAKFV